MYVPVDFVPEAHEDVYKKHLDGLALFEEKAPKVWKRIQKELGDIAK